MLAWFRARMRRLSTLALAAFVVLVGASAAPHQEDCHDAACELLLPHDPDGHGIGSQSGSADDSLHCVFCHLTRSARRPEGTAHVAGPLAQAGSPVAATPFQPLHRYAPAQPPLRAPPSHL